MQSIMPLERVSQWSMHTLSRQLEAVIAEEEPRLRAIGEQPSTPGDAWSKKQELGHLIDSAINNRARFIKAALEGELKGPTYDADGWVRMGGYDEMRWSDLSNLWAALNRSLVPVLDLIPAERLASECSVGGAPPVTLQFLVDDYVVHMRLHLDHSLG